MSGGFPCALAVALAMIQLMAAPRADAATYRVDDSGSVPRESTALLGWRQPVPDRSGDDTLAGTVGVALRLDLSTWVNRPGRLYLVLPKQGTPVLQVSWRTQGRLMPGRVQPGQRVLVYEGLIANPYLDERLELGIEASGGLLTGTQPVTFHFEIDVE